MTQKTARTKVRQPRPGNLPQSSRRGPEAGPGGWGLRWNGGHFRRALALVVLATTLVCAFGQGHGELGLWYLRDGYVATRATVLKAPFWADAQAPKDPDNDAIAGWHVELRVGEHPFTLAVALADFDPTANSIDQRVPPDAHRYAPGSLHPVWFYADQRKATPRTVGLFEQPPPLLISRAAYPRFPSLREAIEDSAGLLVVPAILLALALMYLVLSVVGRRDGNTAGSTLAARLPAVFAAGLFATGAYLINSEHPLDAHSEQYVPAEIEITRGPQPDDRLTHYGGYRVLWRTWQVQARLAGRSGPEFTIDVDGLDPHRVPWASRHSPDIAALQPGMRLPVWQSTFHGATLEHLGSDKPIVNWETFMSRERWPDKYTWRNFVQDSPVAVVFIAGAALLVVVLLVPLGGRRNGGP